LQQNPQAQKENKLGFEEIIAHLAQLERGAGNWQQAINWFQAVQKVAPDPGALQQRIDEIKKIMAAQPSPTNSQPH
jgi:hypothetical protein